MKKEYRNKYFKIASILLGVVVMGLVMAGVLNTQQADEIKEIGGDAIDTSYDIFCGEYPEKCV